MAGSIVPQVCPICKALLRPGERRRVIGIDQSVPGDAPANVMAHWGCAEARGLVGCFLLRPGESLAGLLDTR